jgi:hypothetical protein
MTQYISTVETAKMLRAALKAEFPTAKFSVRKSASGSALNVSWTDGPTVAAVDAIAQRYAGGSFDGQTDSMNFHDDLVYLNGEELPTLVRYSAHFVFTDRDISPEFKADLVKIAQEILDMNDSTKGQTFDEETHYTNLATHLGFAIDGYWGGSMLRKISWDMSREGAVA